VDNTLALRAQTIPVHFL